MRLSETDRVIYMQKPPRLQHYVPQLLLNQFAGEDGKLWAYDAKNRKMFRAAPKCLAAESYFYGPITTRATPKSTAIENWLSHEIDGPGANALAALLQKLTLSHSQIPAFFRFVAAQMQRTPTSLQRITDHFAPVFQESAERMAKFDANFRQNVLARLRKKGATEAELAEFLQILDTGKFTVTPSRDFAISTALRSIEIAAAALTQMRWTFMEIHPTDTDLIIGDHPVTLADVDSDGISAIPLGIKTPSIEIAMSLSPRMVALAHWDGPICYGQLVPGMADMLNERTLRQIHRFAYARLESKELLERAIALRGTGPKVRTRRIQLGEQVIICPELR